jgi:hypothetical protein
MDFEAKINDLNIKIDAIDLEIRQQQAIIETSSSKESDHNFIKAKILKLHEAKHDKEAEKLAIYDLEAKKKQSKFSNNIIFKN